MGVIVFISGVWGELMCISNFDGAKKTNRTRGRCGRVCITDVCKLLALPCTSSALGALGVGTVEWHAGTSAGSGLGQTCFTSGWSCHGRLAQPES